MMDTLLRRPIHVWPADFTQAPKAPQRDNVRPPVPARISPLRVGSGDPAEAAHP